MHWFNKSCRTCCFHLQLPAIISKSLTMTGIELTTFGLIVQCSTNWSISVDTNNCICFLLMLCLSFGQFGLMIGRNSSYNCFELNTWLDLLVSFFTFFFLLTRATISLITAASLLGSTQKNYPTKNTYLVYTPTKFKVCTLETFCDNEDQSQITVFKAKQSKMLESLYVAL